MMNPNNDPLPPSVRDVINKEIEERKRVEAQTQELKEQEFQGALQQALDTSGQVNDTRMNTLLREHDMMPDSNVGRNSTLDNNNDQVNSQNLPDDQNAYMVSIDADPSHVDSTNPVESDKTPENTELESLRRQIEMLQNQVNNLTRLLEESRRDSTTPQEQPRAIELVRPNPDNQISPDGNNNVNDGDVNDATLAPETPTPQPAEPAQRTFAERLQDIFNVNKWKETLQNDSAKRKKLIKVLLGVGGAAIGFGVAVSNPISWLALTGWGVSALVTKFTGRRLSQVVENNTNEIETIQGNVSASAQDRERAEKLRRRNKWLGALATGFEYASPALAGFATGAAVGGLVHNLIDQAAQSSIGSMDRGAQTDNFDSTFGDQRDARLAVENSPSFESISVTDGNSLDVPGPWDNTVLGMGDVGTNPLHPSHYLGGDHGMAATFFRDAVEQTGAPNLDALFGGTNGNTADNVRKVLNAMLDQASSARSNPVEGVVDFAKAYQDVMGSPVPSFK